MIIEAYEARIREKQAPVPGLSETLGLIFGGDLSQPSNFDSSRLIALAVQGDDEQLIRAYLERIPRGAQRDQAEEVVESTLEKASAFPKRICDFLAEFGALRFFPIRAELAAKFSAYNHYAVSEVKPDFIEVPEARRPEPKRCRHSFAWITTPGYRCEVCRKSIDSRILSEERGKVCLDCGLAAHVNCQNRLPNG